MINRTPERIKQTGEVMTPLPLVDEILSKIPEEVWHDHTKTFCDPACGDGNFLVRVIAWKIEYGSTIKQALRTTYGVDIMEDNIEHCKERLIQLADDYDTEIHGIHKAKEKYGQIIDRNIVCADSLNDWDFENWCRISDRQSEEQSEEQQTQPTWSTQEDVINDLLEF